MDKNEKEMYVICFTLLLLCSIGLLLLKNDIRGITGYAIEENATREAALNALVEAKGAVEDMQYSGFSVTYVNDTFFTAQKFFEGENYSEILEDLDRIENESKREEARKLLEAVQTALSSKEEIKANYQEVLRLTDIIIDRKNEAYEINDLLRGLELKIDDYEKLDINTIKARGLFEEAKVAFKEDRYDDSRNLIDEGENLLEEARSEKTIFNVAKSSSVGFFKANWFKMLLTLIILSLTGLIIWYMVRKILIRNKVDGLKIEMDEIVNLMKKAQKDRFEYGKISESMYNLKMEKYKERMNKIKAKIPVLESILRKK